MLDPAVLKQLARLGRTDRERIQHAIERLPAGDTRRLQGNVGEWRLRVGDWRVRFRFREPERIIEVMLVAARGGAYKR